MNVSLRDEVKHVPVSLSVNVSLRDEVKHVPVSRAQEILISKSVQPSDDVIGDIRTCIIIH